MESWRDRGFSFGGVLCQEQGKAKVMMSTASVEGMGITPQQRCRFGKVLHKLFAAVYDAAGGWQR